jgi:hypothetical protein
VQENHVPTDWERPELSNRDRALTSNFGVVLAARVITALAAVRLARGLAE